MYTCQRPCDVIPAFHVSYALGGEPLLPLAARMADLPHLLSI